MLARGEDIIFGQGAPARISETSSWFECRFCAMRGVCFGTEMPKVNCRTCIYSKPDPAGGWVCLNGQPEITSAPKLGCAQHIFHPMFMPHAKVLAIDHSSVTYSHRGQTIVNGPAATPSPCLDLRC